MPRINWKRLDYVTHRWIGIVLGLLVLVWFTSGIVMIYYPWPAPTESETLERLHAFLPDPNVVGFAAARDAGQRYLDSAAAGAGHAAPRLVGGRLMSWNGQLVYSLWQLHRFVDQPMVLVDAHSERILSPIGAGDAVTAARAVVGPLPVATQIGVLQEGDHYLLSSEYQPGFPAYQVRFDDASATTVYVSRAAGYVVGIVTNLTRWTTWLGTVPHWLYFKWLYHRATAWLWVSLVLPAIAMLAGLTGIALGVWQLFPRRHRGEWRVSAYRGVSKWHHISGVVFGVLVFTWSLSGMLEVLGPDGEPEPSQITRARGAHVDWGAIRLPVADAAGRLQSLHGATVLPVAVDVLDLQGVPGYLFHLQGQKEYWVNAVTGEARGEFDSATAVSVASRALATTAPVLGAQVLTRYDTYYYARPHREMHLPAWRVTFGDPAHSVLYLDPVSGSPVGFVNDHDRWYRWLRDGLHSFDFPGLNDKRPAWDFVLIPLMLGGTVAAFTGVWLLTRRLKRMM